MSHASLTTRYRPQTFADLAGQSTLKTILSRAVAEGKVAPAYLFSGTRGVGKTTIARIFAKALNCRNQINTGHGIEPCNQCDQCRAVTMGSSVDVVEIDGASNRGIDDVRKLKESVGYAPMEGRYKVFIIDEAHMLSREAFNALLKTLEEPPARVTFIMATTEPHKFPVTIVSRCQHYVFKRLSDAELEDHLKKVLNAEQQPYEDAALRLIVRRAAGSVRDAMSLLGQVLALGGEILAEADTRAVLGLAGQELFFRMLAAVKASDCAGLSRLVRDMLDQGVDLGFFLRELTAMWRNLFMLRQVGQEAIPLVELPEAEALRWLDEAQNMQLSHIHACWQLTLEGQRRVLTSLEPAMALELLLLNLAMLPRLIAMEQFSSLSRKAASAQGAAGTADTGAEKKSPLTGDNPVATGQAAQTSHAAPQFMPHAGAAGPATIPNGQSFSNHKAGASGKAAGTMAGTAVPSAASSAGSNATRNPDLAPQTPNLESTPDSELRLAAEEFPVDESLAALAAKAEAAAMSELEILDGQAEHDEQAGANAGIGLHETGGPEQVQGGISEAADAFFNEHPAPDNPAVSFSGGSAPLAMETPDRAGVQNAPEAFQAPGGFNEPYEPGEPREAGEHGESGGSGVSSELGEPDETGRRNQAGTPANSQFPQDDPDDFDEHDDDGEELDVRPTAQFQRHAMAGPRGLAGDWPGFQAYCASELEISPTTKSLISELKANWSGNSLELTPPSNFLNKRLADPEVRKTLEALLRSFCGLLPAITVMPVPEIKSDRHQIREEVEALPIVKALKETMQAELIDCGPWYK